MQEQDFTGGDIACYCDEQDCSSIRKGHNKMNRELLKLLKQLIDGPGEGCPPFDKGAYSSLSWTAQDRSYLATTPEEKALCLWLRDLAAKKALELAVGGAACFCGKWGNAVCSECGEIICSKHVRRSIGESRDFCKSCWIETGRGAEKQNGGDE